MRQPGQRDQGAKYPFHPWIRRHAPRLARTCIAPSMPRHSQSPRTTTFRSQPGTRGAAVMRGESALDQLMPAAAMPSPRAASASRRSRVHSAAPASRVAPSR